MNTAILTTLLATTSVLMPAPVLAGNALGSAKDVVSVELLEGWREDDGRHIAAIRMTLSEGWKTYWRAPGDGGLPTALQWNHSNNLENLRILWPRPQVFDDAGMRSLGYMNEVVLPLELTPNQAGEIELNARLNFGVCKEVCVPAVVNISQVLGDYEMTGVTEIRSALTANPEPAGTDNLRDVTCTFEATDKGHKLYVEVDAELPEAGRAMVVETGDREIWVGRTELVSNGSNWHGVTHLFDHRDDRPTILSSDIRITLLTDTMAVDIQRCSLD